MPKHRNTVYYDFKSRFLVIFLVITGFVENTVARPYFSQNFEIPYWKSSFPVHLEILSFSLINIRSGSRAATTSKMECFVTIVNGFQPLTIITKHSILDVATALDPSLNMEFLCEFTKFDRILLLYNTSRWLLLSFLFQLKN